MRQFLKRFQIQSRERKLKLLLESFKPKPEDKALAVGIYAIKHLDYLNYVEYNYPYRQSLTALTIDPPEKWCEEAKQLNLVHGNGSHLPFPDDNFDIAFSNAVIEHVGSREQQKKFVEEMCRVAPKVFITTPNFYFPLELHIRLPFVHYLPVKLARWIMLRCGQNRRYYAKQWGTELNLLTSSQLRKLFPDNFDVEIIPLRMTFMAETLIAIARRKRE